MCFFLGQNWTCDVFESVWEVSLTVNWAQKGRLMFTRKNYEGRESFVGGTGQTIGTLFFPVPQLSNNHQQSDPLQNGPNTVHTSYMTTIPNILWILATNIHNNFTVNYVAIFSRWHLVAPQSFVPKVPIKPEHCLSHFLVLIIIGRRAIFK